MTSSQLLRVCASYAALGTSVQDQIREVIFEGEPAEDMNPNALKMAREWFTQAAQRGFDADEARDAIEMLTEPHSTDRAATPPR